MLPSPALSTRKRGHGGLHLHPSSFRQRSRITNLGVIILITCLCLSLLFNLRQWLILSRSPNLSMSQVLPSYADFKKEDPSLNLTPPVNARRLIIVAGHAIWKGCLPERRLDNDDWVLEQYQRGMSGVTTYFSHIAKG